MCVCVVVVWSSGNILNGGTQRGGAYGFKLETLLKIDGMKAADNKSTPLDFLAQYAVNAPSAASILDLAQVRSWPRASSGVLNDGTLCCAAWLCAVVVQGMTPVAAAKAESLQQIQSDLDGLNRSLKQGMNEVGSSTMRVWCTAAAVTC